MLSWPTHAVAVTITMQPLTSFGVNGWLSGTAFGITGTNSSIRSMAFNPATGNVTVANGSTVQLVNGTTGAIGASLNATGVSGGTRAFNTVTVTSDGVIYGSNLVTSSTASAFKIYRWANEAAAPTVFYSGDAGVSSSARAGDSLTVFGSDATGMLAIGTGTLNSGTTPTTYYSLLPTNSGVAGSATAMTGTGAANASFRTGLALVDADTVLGLGAGSTTNNATVSGTTAPWTGNGLRTIQNANERSISAVTAIFGTPLMATVQIGNVGINTVRLYDASNLMTSSSIPLLATALISTGSITNGNGSVGIAFGTVNGDPVLYAMNTNNGIQAFQIVPEPTTTAVALACGAGLVALMRRRGRGQNS
jgi:hypothetical protein